MDERLDGGRRHIESGERALDRGAQDEAPFLLGTVWPTKDGQDDGA